MSRKSAKVAGLILAAGPSSRLGHPKQLVTLSDGRTLLQKTIDEFRNSNLEGVLTVLGANQEKILKHSEEFLGQFIANPNWKLGMESSLNAGVSHLIENHPSLQGILIGVCDQPFLSKEHLNLLLAEFATNTIQIVASRYAGTVGVPAVFSSDLFDELIAVDNSKGARVLLQKYRTQVLGIDFEKGEIDIDKSEDLYHLK